MERQHFIDRLSFPTEFRNVKELKTSIILLFIVCLSFFIISSITIIHHLFLFSKTLLAGTIAYEFILFYLLGRYTKEFINKKINKKNIKKTLSLTSSVIFAILIILTFTTLIYTMITKTPISENKFISLSSALLLIISPTFFWDELVHHFKKKILKKIKLLSVFLLFLIIINSVNATNSTNNSNTITNTFNTIEKSINTINYIKDLINNFQENINNVLNLTPQQTQIITIIGILIGAFLLLKFLSVIVKWVIIILIIWIIIQLLMS